MVKQGLTRDLEVLPSSPREWCFMHVSTMSKHKPSIQTLTLWTDWSDSEGGRSRSFCQTGKRTWCNHPGLGEFDKDSLLLKTFPRLWYRDWHRQAMVVVRSCLP